VAKCGIKTLVHLAWVTQPGVYLESEENDLWVTRSLALIEGLLAAGLEHCVSTGTCIEYDPSAVEPCDEETTPIVPRSRYAQCKVELYRELVSRFKLNESTLSWVRVFHVYGEGEHPMRFVTSMAKTFLSGGVVDLKTPSSVRDFVDVRNVTGILALAIAERFDGVVNAGSGNGVTIRHAAESIAELCGRTRDSVRCSAAQADPTPNIVAGTKRMAALGAPPPIDYRIGFAQLIENLNQTL
jgi:dTDP-6-deoxy-L-talose 4-dehydrogenase (NAD+)